MAVEVEEKPKEKLKLVECPRCGRSFAKDRIDKHTEVCAKQKERKIFDVTRQRITGTEAEDLVKTGKLKLEPPRPNEKKSALNEKLNATLTKDVLPPITDKSKSVSEPVLNKNPDNEDRKRNVTAYQVVFDDNNKLRTKKSTKFPTAVPPPLRGQARLPTAKMDIDDRYLSAERAKNHWQSAAMKARPRLSSSMSALLDVDEDDYLNSSQKTVCSDAFDFLFDSQNLNPEKVLNHEEIERYTEEKMKETNRLAMENDKNLVKDSQCCTIS